MPDITGLEACTGKEKFMFRTPLKLRGKVEIYMQHVIDHIIDQQRVVVGEMQIKRAELDLESWYKADIAAPTIVVNQITWCKNVEDAFEAIAGGKTDAMNQYLQIVLDGINNLVKIVQNPDLDKGYRRKVMVIITMEVHSREIVDELIKEKVRKPTDFKWQAQLKLYW
jgi:dynein heavy chain